MPVSDMVHQVMIRVLDEAPLIGKDVTIEEFIERYKFAKNLQQWGNGQLCHEPSWKQNEGDNKVVAIFVNEKENKARYILRNGQCHKTKLKETEPSVKDIVSSIKDKYFTEISIDELLSSINLDAVFKKGGKGEKPKEVIVDKI